MYHEIEILHLLGMEGDWRSPTRSSGRRRVPDVIITAVTTVTTITMFAIITIITMTSINHIIIIIAIIIITIIIIIIVIIVVVRIATIRRAGGRVLGRRRVPDVAHVRNRGGLRR